jgi:predicted ABC-type ATPase
MSQPEMVAIAGPNGAGKSTFYATFLAQAGLKASFAFETVFSDPEGQKARFLQEAAQQGYRVTLCFIGLGQAELSLNRVALRVSQGGHDVPDEKLLNRYPRSLANLARAIRIVPEVRVYDNSDLRRPYRHLGTFRAGQQSFLAETLPHWFGEVLRKTAPED